jgi:hypothetical protein
MRLRIDTAGIEFRVAGAVRPRQVSRDDSRQKTTPASDGSRPVWTVRLTAYDSATGSTEMIWVEVAGQEPQLTPNEVAIVQGLTYAPWVNNKKEIVRAFRAEAVTLAGNVRRPAA